MPTQRHLVALAFTRGADHLLIDAELTARDVDQLDGLARWLVRQGHLAAYAVVPAPVLTDGAGALGAIRGRMGDLVVDSNLAAGPPPAEPLPAFLAAVWPFDHEIAGMSAATGQFLGLDLEVIAIPSIDEEEGASVPGLSGLRHVYARPLCSADFVPKASQSAP